MPPREESRQKAPSGAFLFLGPGNLKSRFGPLCRPLTLTPDFLTMLVSGKFGQTVKTVKPAAQNLEPNFLSLAPKL
jgi:hypothetical protein